MCHSHIQRLVGWECNMASQQGRLLHDGIVMAIVRVGIPAGQDGLMLITEHVSEKGRCHMWENSKRCISHIGQ